MTRLTTEDMLAIQDLFARYNWYFDGGDAELWAGLWAEDGTFDNGGSATQGHSALRALAKGSYDAFDGGIRHHMTDLLAEYGETRDEVRAKLCNLLTNWQSGGQLFGVITCDVTLTRDGDDWKIRNSQCVMRRAQPAG